MRCGHPRRAFGDSAHLHNALGDHIHIRLDVFGNFVKQFVQTDEVRPFHIPMRLLELCLEIRCRQAVGSGFQPIPLGPPLEYRFPSRIAPPSPHFVSVWFSFYCAAIAAASITFATSDGFEMNPTWLALISFVCAPILLAMNLSRSGLIALSWVDTTYHDGMVFQAAALTGSPKIAAASGFWVAASNSASSSGRSFANTP